MIIPILIAMAGYAVYKSSRGEDHPIGTDAQGTEIFYADSSERSKPAYYKGVYTGQRYECVEYSRRWLIRNRGVTFDPIESAIDLLDLKEARSIHKFDRVYPVIPVEREYEVGDLVIFEPSQENSFYGHVGVITKLYEDHVEMTEQNRSPSDFVRDLRLKDGRLTDRSVMGVRRVLK